MIRDFFAKHIVAFGLWITPEPIRTVVTMFLSMSEGIVKQIELGREGGVIVILPWASTEDGRKLAALQMDACTKLAADMRVEYNYRKELSNAQAL